MVRSFFFIPTHNRLEKIFFHDIIYIQACKDDVQIVTENSIFDSDVSLDQVQKALPAESFCRINLTCIISIEKIISFDDKLVCMPGANLPVAEPYRFLLQNQVMILNRNRNFFSSFIVNMQGLLVRKRNRD